MNDVSYLITGGAMIFSSVGFWTFIQHWIDKKSVTRTAILGLMYLSVKMSCQKLIDRGYASVEEIEDIEKYIYEPYHALGGDGTAEMLMEKVKTLPTKPIITDNPQYK